MMKFKRYGKNRLITAGIATALVLSGMSIPQGKISAKAEEIETMTVPANRFGKYKLAKLSDEALAESDELFSEYVEAKFEPKMAMTAEKDMQGSKLKGLDRTLYLLLKEDVKKVANGELSNTIFNYDIEQIGLKDKWTAEELGVDSLYENGDISPKAVDAMEAKWDFSLSNVILALLQDHPAELYWFDKTNDIKAEYVSQQAQSITITTMNGVQYMILNGAPGIQFKLSVSKNYRIPGEMSSTLSYKTDTTKTKAAQNAVNNAKKVVSDNASQNDRGKLTKYKEYICDQVEYDRKAASGSVDYGDPWQIISVFDENASTNVVCEGYAKAFQYLCDLTDFEDKTINTYSVTGTMSGGTGSGPHMWNITSMNGSNFLVDVTNCDGSSVGAPDNLFLVILNGNVEGGYKYSKNGNVVTYTYDEETLESYTVDELTIGNDVYHYHVFNSSEECSCGKKKGSISNKNYPTTYVYSGEPVIPNGGNFTNNTGKTPEFTWYKGNKTDTTLPTGGADYLAGKAPVNVGTYTLVASITEEKNDKYTSAETRVLVNITPAKASVAALDKTINVGDKIPSLAKPVLGVDYSISGLYKNDELSGTVTLKYEETPLNTKAGTYKINISGLEGTNYDVEFVQGTLTIKDKKSEDSDNSKGESDKPDGNDQGNNGNSDNKPENNDSGNDGSTDNSSGNNNSGTENNNSGTENNNSGTGNNNSGTENNNSGTGNNNSEAGITPGTGNNPNPGSSTGNNEAGNGTTTGNNNSNAINKPENNKPTNNDTTNNTTNTTINDTTDDTTDDDSDYDDNLGDEDQKEQKLANGDKIKVGSITYKVINVNSKTVEYVSGSSKATSITVSPTVKYDGITFKITKISSKAFKNNKKLTKVVIGKNIKTIGSSAFTGCTKLKTITIKTTSLTKSSVKNSLKGSKITKIKVPASKVKAYKGIFTEKNCGRKVTVVK